MKKKCGDCIARLDWCVDHLRQKWKLNFVNFDIAFEKIKEIDKTFIDFDTINLWEIEDDEF